MSGTRRRCPPRCRASGRRPCSCSQGRCPSRAAASSSIPGRGLRQSQSSPSSWKQIRKSSIGSIARHAALIASTSLSRDCAAGDVRLVGHHDQQDSRSPSSRSSARGTPGRISSSSDPRRRIGLAVAHDRALSTPSRSRKTARLRHARRRFPFGLRWPSAPGATPAGARPPPETPRSAA